ncbi:cyclic nucleotide-binding domain-containing protein [Candidatus Dependentiae bacterium]|nr:cyclic nucleotide-binding domain-containing protein [Candidatus Dependentiae bacterium]
MGYTEFLKSNKFFKNLNDEDLASLEKFAELKKFQKNEMIFSEEEAGDELFIIKSGTVKVLRQIKNEEQTIVILNPGEFFGEMALFDKYPRSASVKMMDDGELVVLEKSDFEEMKTKVPSLVIKLMEIVITTLSDRLRQANRNFEVISFWLT